MSPVRSARLERNQVIGSGLTVFEPRNAAIREDAKLDADGNRK